MIFSRLSFDATIEFSSPIWDYRSRFVCIKLLILTSLSIQFFWNSSLSCLMWTSSSRKLLANCSSSLRSAAASSWIFYIWSVKLSRWPWSWRICCSISCLCASISFISFSWLACLFISFCCFEMWSCAWSFWFVMLLMIVCISLISFCRCCLSWIRT